ncbi:sirohydrochlorin cobaltochelatase [Desulfogranum mediterraneum]|uniref:sirohydrochlorin cobaltochelatase n=1 Tax=Desulfogranum mediterraneum TaxID=160661 RepID=UPI00040DD66F|nr:sirohydrochlorin cobaltochelatase [Desulfogranum mediterraneum]
MNQKSAIVLAMFGTTAPPALAALLHIRTRVQEAFPGTLVRLAFTSNLIRKIWQQRSHDQSYRDQHPQIPDEIYTIQGPLAAMANLQDQGHQELAIQAIHIAPAEEFHDLSSYVRALNSIRTMKPRWQPFQALALGRPLFGSYNPSHPYSADIRAAAEALAEDVALAREHGAALVYMGHGNPLFPAGGLYLELAARMNQLYPDTPTFLATIEGFPCLDELLPQLLERRISKVLLKPLLIVAGAHALRDMAGSGEDSWQSRLSRTGIEVIPVLRGLGEQPAVARIFVQHLAEAAAEAGIELC